MRGFKCYLCSFERLSHFHKNTTTAGNLICIPRPLHLRRKQLSLEALWAKKCTLPPFFKNKIRDNTIHLFVYNHTDEIG